MKNVQYSFERYEKKYSLNKESYQKILKGIAPFMAADEYGKTKILSIYCDTDDWRLIRASIEKPDYKEKLRFRSYGVATSDSTVFAELKKKCGGIVYKRRVGLKCDDLSALLNGDDLQKFGQIGSELAWFQKKYQTKKKVLIAYDRTAYFGREDSALRITFDENLRYRTDRLDLRAGDDGKPIPLAPEILMEIKIPGVCPIWLSRLLSQNGIFPTSFSKYGTFYCNNILKNSTKEAHLCA